MNSTYVIYDICHLYPFRNILWVASFLLGLCMIIFAICHSYTLLLSILFTKLRTVTVSIAMSVGLSVCLLICSSASLGPQRMDFVWWELLSYSVEKLQLSLKSDQKKNIICEEISTFITMPHWIFHEVRKFLDNISRENQNKYCRLNRFYRNQTFMRY